MTKEQQEQFKRELEEIAQKYKDVPSLDCGPFEPFSFMATMDAFFQTKDSEYGPV